MPLIRASALLALGVFLLVPGIAQADVDLKQFNKSAKACDFLVERVSRQPFLCPTSLPPRVAAPNDRYLAGAEIPWKLSYLMIWKAQKRGVIGLMRLPRQGLRWERRYLRRDGVRIRDVEVRGRAAIIGCDENYCLLGWREHGTTYFIHRFGRNLARLRLRRDLRAVAGALEPVPVVADGGP